MSSPVSDLVERQFTSVLAAPVAFMRACSVAIRCIWSLFGWTFSARLERHKATIEGLKEEQDRLRAKLEEEAVCGAHGARTASFRKPSILILGGLRRRIDPSAGASTRTAADRLMARTEGLTGAKARDVIRNAIGQPLTVPGELFQVTDIWIKFTVTDGTR
jgi:hypothetical protein